MTNGAPVSHMFHTIHIPNTIVLRCGCCVASQWAEWGCCAWSSDHAGSVTRGIGKLGVKGCRLCGSSMRRKLEHGNEGRGGICRGLT